MIHSTTYSSPLGKLLLAANGASLIGVWMEGQKYFGGAITEDMTDKSDLSILIVAKKWLDEYFAGLKPAISDLPLAPEGSAFRRAVWDILCGIPYGEVTTYGDIAKTMAGATNEMSVSSQAVGGAVGRNPISIIIPCHRVISANGSLTGYAGGIDKKYYLLAHEGVDMSRLYKPGKGKAR
ncbi:MAG: methylated-DNA--[protein]-cysteine S-methyltransferase [Clostridiales bacterium]|jgi:methylated-DNA-[protein]-cysteine S-methyltransferase|nr:methylated-DNA--[protein]-cysteine S-methyltransferase [Clostridiales bacterium]